MAESSWKVNNGSSEESLPLSQETCNFLWNMMDLSGREEMLAGFDTGNHNPSELSSVPAALPPQSLLGAHIPSTGSSLPAISNWPGDFNFKLLFEHQDKVNKHTTWTYSEVDNKLYVKKDAHCPFSFQTNAVMPGGVVLRAMAAYSSPESASTVVTRCVNHSQQEILQGIYEPEHLIRSDSLLAQYEVSAETHRHSVVVPFENPPVGQDFSTYIFSFVCFGSCAGGPNRRPLTLIFTLEHGAKALGRIALDLKISACPKRDRENAEKTKPGAAIAEPSAKKRMSEPSISSIPQNFFGNLPKKKKAEVKPEDRKVFNIEVRDKECYKFLLDMKRLYLTKKRIDILPEEYKALLHVLRSSSDEDCT